MCNICRELNGFASSVASLKMIELRRLFGKTKIKRESIEMYNKDVDHPNHKRPQQGWIQPLNC